MVAGRRAAGTAGARSRRSSGFPSGKHLSAIKAHEAALAVAAGADEIDMVIDVGAALAGDFDAVRADIAAVRAAVPDAVLKVIVESAALLGLAGEQTLVDVCRAAEDAGADFVKTSTGFHPAGGASVRAVELMAATVGGRLGVKASGGIRTAADAARDAGRGRHPAGAVREPAPCSTGSADRWPTLRGRRSRGRCRCRRDRGVLGREAGSTTPVSVTCDAVGVDAQRVVLGQLSR